MPPQPPPQPTFQERYAQAQWLLQFPALSVILYLRPDLGYRLVNLLRLLAVTIVMIMVAAFSQQNHDDNTGLFLIFFAMGAFILGIGQRIKGWWRINRGIAHHSYYIGTSLLRFGWLPDFFHRNRRVERVIDPLFCALVGLALRPLAVGLSGWLILSGISLYLYEFGICERELNRDLDTLDSLIDAERQSQTVERFEFSSKPQPPASHAGISTGNSDDIQELLKRRR